MTKWGGQQGRVREKGCRFGTKVNDRAAGNRSLLIGQTHKYILIQQIIVLVGQTHIEIHLHTVVWPLRLAKPAIRSLSRLQNGIFKLALTIFFYRM
jgi:hypothetical protein